MGEDNKKELVDNAVQNLIDANKTDEAVETLKKAKAVLEGNPVIKHAALICYIDTGTAHGFISDFENLESLDSITTYLLDFNSKLIKDTTKKALEQTAANIKESIKGEKDE